MRRLFLWLILLFPALELWLLVLAGSRIGVLATLGLVVLSMAAGFVLLRLCGVHVAQSMRAELAAGRIPANPLLDAFCLMAAGWLLIVPGFISDIFALLLLVPAARRALFALIVALGRKQGFQAQSMGFQTFSGRESNDGGPVVWTRAAWGDAGSFEADRSREAHGNAVIIDCEAEAARPEEEGPGKAVTTPGEGEKSR
ncbi:MAG: FxsA family protein [Deltaproteobacteria bacterium]|jgi:UPF0716 protein FxsA|nr:FxsA family protein [Deltaproteobacteria bacterium]